LPRDPREISPTDLVQAKYEIVPYVDITGMKADLIAWCGDRSRVTAGRLVHGPEDMADRPAWWRALRPRLRIRPASWRRAD
jgi:hypothetical protein